MRISVIIIKGDFWITRTRLKNMQLKKLLATGVISILAGFTYAANAASFIIPSHYNAEIVDGFEDNLDIKNRVINLSEGRHQIVLLFKDTFGTNQDSRIIQATDPIVIDIANIQKDDVYTFTYTMPRTEAQANHFARNQKINLINKTTGKPLTQDEATYFILASNAGFTVLRNYKQDLITVGRLYNRNEVDVNGNVTTSDDGVQTVNVVNSSLLLSTSSQNPVSEQGLTYYGEKKSAAKARGGSSVTYNQLVDLYNKADDKTKLQFMKYIMNN